MAIISESETETCAPWTTTVLLTPFFSHIIITTNFFFFCPLCVHRGRWVQFSVVARMFFFDPRFVFSFTFDRPASRASPLYLEIPRKPICCCLFRFQETCRVEGKRCYPKGGGVGTLPEHVNRQSGTSSRQNRERAGGRGGTKIPSRRLPA